MAAAAIFRNRKIESLTDWHHAYAFYLPNKTANIIKQNWNQFHFLVKATAL